MKRRGLTEFGRLSPKMRGLTEFGCFGSSNVECETLQVGSAPLVTLHP